MTSFCTLDAEQEAAASRKGAIAPGAPLCDPYTKIDADVPTPARVKLASKPTSSSTKKPVKASKPTKRPY